MRFAIGLLTGILLTIALPVVLIAGGVVDMGAAGGPGVLEEVLGHWAVERWVQTDAPEGDALQPAPPTTEAWLRGLDVYAASCVHCHGAPDVPPAEWARHMVPNPPDLTHSNDEFTDAELFLVVHDGVRMTGMPPFGETHSDEDLWDVVRFVRDLEHIDASHADRLREAVAPMNPPQPEEAAPEEDAGSGT